MNIFQAIIVGLLQGIAELFPISSLGHSIIIPALLHWNLGDNSDIFLTFLVATHFATAVVLFIFYRHDWVKIIKGLGRLVRDRKLAPGDRDAKLGLLLVIATIPAGLIGLILEKPIRIVIAQPTLIAFILILNGVIIFLAERSVQRRERVRAAAGPQTVELTNLSKTRALQIGLAQSAALIPGISRSGVSIVAGLFSGLTHEDAARFSFLLATPIIGAAALLKLPSLASSAVRPDLLAIILGAIAAAASAYVAVRFLTKYFETKTLRPFAIYCMIGGLVYFIILMVTS